jgi:hypothetical protein
VSKNAGSVRKSALIGIFNLGLEPYPNVASRDSDEHYRAIGKMVTNWAALEAIVTSAIWQAAEMPDVYGACVTSQIFTFDGKIKALVAILHARGEFEAQIAALNKFQDEARGTLSFRNRIVHDALHFDATTGAPQRLEITANKKPVLAFIDEPTSNVLARSRKAVELLEKFQGIMAPVFERVRPLFLNGGPSR